MHLLSFQNISVKSGTKITGSLDTGGKIQAIQSGSRTIQPTLNGTVDLTGFALISPEETEGERESISRDDHTSNVIYNSWNKDTVDNGPTCSPFFTIDEPMTITYIDTFHWNYGEGAPGGTIGLRDGDGTVHGPWQAESSREGGEVPRGYWIAHPNEVIPAGPYTIEDSDPDTWSQNSESPCGLARVEGYAASSGGVADQPGKSAIKEDSINHPPKVDLKFSPKRPTSEDNITLTAEAQDPDGDDLTYEWFVGNMAASFKAGSDKQMQLQLDPGDYQYSVKVADGKGGEAEDVVRFTVKAKYD